MLDQAREADGNDEEQPDGEHERHHHRARPHAAGNLAVVLGQLGVGRQVERSKADPQRLHEGNDAAQERQAQPSDGARARS